MFYNCALKVTLLARNTIYKSPSEQVGKQARKPAAIRRAQYDFTASLAQTVRPPLQESGEDKLKHQ